MHAVNLGEVYYDTLRFAGADVAAQVFEDVRQLPIKVVWKLDELTLRTVGRFKTGFRLSYADAFVLALAEQKKGKIVSTDHHELDALVAAGVVDVFWLR